MTMLACKYKYGHGYKEFSIAQEKVLAEVKVAELPPIENLEAAILTAIRQPIASPALEKLVKPGQKIAFICNDPTRVANSYAFMPILVKELNRLGIRDEDMKIVFALGTHRKMTQEEMVAAVGENVASRLKMYNSDCNDSEAFNYF